jgi:hypothetical protein
LIDEENGVDDALLATNESVSLSRMRALVLADYSRLSEQTKREIAFLAISPPAVRRLLVLLLSLVRSEEA